MRGSGGEGGNNTGVDLCREGGRRCRPDNILNTEFHDLVFPKAGEKVSRWPVMAIAPENMTGVAATQGNDLIRTKHLALLDYILPVHAGGGVRGCLQGFY